MRRNTHLLQPAMRPVMRPGDRLSIATLLFLALFSSGCSGTSLLGTTPATTSTAPATATSSPPSVKDKISSFFSGSTATSQQNVTGTALNIDCPLINIRQGASTLTIGPTGNNGSVTSTNNGAMAVKYQGTFVRAARECALVSGNVVMKIGVEGRIIVGPAGGPGQVDVPLRVAVVDETPAGTKPIFTKFIRIPVTVASATDNPTFTDIEEGVTFPMPNDLENYIVYIGFDPLAAQAQDRPKPVVKPKPKTKPTAKTG
jgi:hypothetical protein